MLNTTARTRRGDTVSHQRFFPTRRRRDAGFSLAEMLAVLALIGIVIAIGIPLVNEQLRIAEVRGAADQMGVHLRAARMLAVTQHRSIDLTTDTTTNKYRYFRQPSSADMVEVSMPGQVIIKSGSAATITFKSDGSASAAGTVTLESTVPNATERWTLTVNTMGHVTITHVRV
jgi:type IV fimbrial biogenesis protein FimT